MSAGGVFRSVVGAARRSVGLTGKLLAVDEVDILNGGVDRMGHLGLQGGEQRRVRSRGQTDR